MAEPIVLPSRLSFLYSLGDSKEIGARGVSPLAPNRRIILRSTGDHFSASAVAHRAEARAFAAQPHLAAVERGGRGQAHRAEARAFAAQPHLAEIRKTRGKQTNLQFESKLLLLHEKAPNDGHRRP
jgi:hypothetical protein